MNQLPTQFEGRADQRGYIFTQLKRVGDVALFEKRNPAHPVGAFPSYEVVIVQHRPKTTWPGGRVTEACETMPSPEKWGMCAWSPATLEDANQKFADLVCLNS